MEWCTCALCRELWRLTIELAAASALTMIELTHLERDESRLYWWPSNLED
jgi:hypothetical protein